MNPIHIQCMSAPSATFPSVIVTTVMNAWIERREKDLGGKGLQGLAESETSSINKSLDIQLVI